MPSGVERNKGQFLGIETEFVFKTCIHIMNIKDFACFGKYAPSCSNRKNSLLRMEHIYVLVHFLYQAFYHTQCIEKNPYKIGFL